jgi:hypothetical protein
MKKNSLSIAIIFLIIFSYWVSLTLCLPSDYQLSGILVFILSIVIMCPLFLLLLRRQDNDLFEIINFVSLVLILNYVVRPVVLIFFPDLTPHPEIITPSIFNQTFCWLILGVIALFAGYYMVPNLEKLNVLNFLKYDWRLPTTLSKLIFLFTFGLGAVVYGALHGYFGRVEYKSVQEFEAQNYVLHFSRYMWYAVLGLLVTNKSFESLLQRIIFIILLGTTVVIVILSGSRGDLIFLAMMFLTASYYRGLLPRLKKYLFPGAIIFFLIFSYMQLFREVVHKKGGIGVDAAKSFAEEINEVGEDDGHLEGLVKRAMKRQHMFDSFALIVTKTPEESPYVGMNDFTIILPKALIPRFLWPNKPDFEFTTIFVKNYWKYGIWPAPSSFGSLYARGGPLLLVVGMFFWGILLRLAYMVVLQQSQKSTTGIFLYSILIFPLVQITSENDIAQVYDLVKMVIYLIPFLLLLRLRVWPEGTWPVKLNN